MVYKLVTRIEQYELEITNKFQVTTTHATDLLIQPFDL